MRVRPASSSTRWILIRVILSRAREGGQDLTPERLDTPASKAFHTRELVRVARARLRHRADQAVRKQHARLETEARRGFAAPHAQRLDASPHGGGNVRARPALEHGQLALR